MLPKNKPQRTRAWKKLEAHYKKTHHNHLRDLFKKDTERFKRFSITFGDILFDYSKNRITDKTLQLLLDLADECKVTEAIEAMFSGEKINETEGRAVLHTALRNITGKPVIVDGRDVMPQVQRVLRQMQNFCNDIH